MRASIPPDLAERRHYDHDALRLMLSYVEAECLRIGATDAARHAALAAALMPGTAAETEQPAAVKANPQGAEGGAAARAARAEVTRPRRAPRGMRLH